MIFKRKQKRYLFDEKLIEEFEQVENNNSVETELLDKLPEMKSGVVFSLEKGVGKYKIPDNINNLSAREKNEIFRAVKSNTPTAGGMWKGAKEMSYFKGVRLGSKKFMNVLIAMILTKQEAFMYVDENKVCHFYKITPDTNPMYSEMGSGKLKYLGPKAPENAHAWTKYDKNYYIVDSKEKEDEEMEKEFNINISRETLSELKKLIRTIEVAASKEENEFEDDLEENEFEDDLEENEFEDEDDLEENEFEDEDDLEENEFEDASEYTLKDLKKDSQQANNVYIVSDMEHPSNKSEYTFLGTNSGMYGFNFNAYWHTSSKSLVIFGGRSLPNYITKMATKVKNKELQASLSDSDEEEVLDTRKKRKSKDSFKSFNKIFGGKSLNDNYESEDIKQGAIANAWSARGR